MNNRIFDILFLRVVELESKLDRSGITQANITQTLTFQNFLGWKEVSLLQGVKSVHEHEVKTRLSHFDYDILWCSKYGECFTLIKQVSLHNIRVHLWGNNIEIVFRILFVEKKLLLANYNYLRLVSIKVVVSFVNQVKKSLPALIVFYDELTTQDFTVFIIFINKRNSIWISHVGPVACFYASSREQNVLLTYLIYRYLRSFAIKDNKEVLNLDSA